MAGKSGKIVHIVFQIVFLALATVGFALYATMAVEFVSSSIAQDIEGGLGNGLSVAVSLVFMLIFSIPTGALALIDLVISIFMVRRRDKGLRIFGIVSIVICALYVILTAVGCPVLIALYN